MTILLALHPVTIVQLVVTKIIRHAIHAMPAVGNCVICLRVKIIIVAVYIQPPGRKRADLRIAEADIVANKPGVFHALGTNAVRTEVIVKVTGAVGCSDLLDAGQFFTAAIVGIVLPAGQRHTVRIQFSIRINTVKCGCTNRALQHAVHKAVAVSRGRDRSAPVYHRIAALAIGAAGIAILRAGGSLIRQRCGSVDMAAVPRVVIGLALGGGDHILRHLVHFGIHMRAFAGEGIGRTVDKGHKAAVDLHADIDRPELLHIAELLIGKGRLSVLRAAFVSVARFELPCADGQRSQNALACIGIAAGAGDGDGSDILIILNRICRLKAGGHSHVLQLPAAHVVQVDIDRDRLDLLDICRHNIGIPDRTELDLIERRIVGHDLHGRFAGIRLHIDRADHRGVVALIIADRELDMMQAVGQDSVNNGEYAVLEGARSFHAVDIGLCRRAVKTGIVILLHVVGDLCAEADRAVGNRLAVQRDGIGHRTGGIGHIAEYRSLAIGYRVGIVDGNIVDIHDVASVIGLVLVVVIVISGAVTVRNIELDHIVVDQIQTLVTAQIDGQIVPAGFLILVHKAGRGSDAVAQGVCERTACADILARIVQNQRIYHITDPCRNILIGDIDPHAQLCSIFIFLFFTLIVKGGHHIAGLQRVAVVDIQRHSAVAAVDLAGLCGHGIDLAFGKHIVVFRIAEFKHAGIAVFKIENDLRAFAELDFGRCLHIRTVNSRRDRALRHAAITSGEIESLDRTDRSIGQRKRQILRLELHLIQAIGRRQAQRDRLPKRRRHLVTVERQLLRQNGMDRQRTNAAALIHCRQRYIAGGTGRQNAVRIGTVGHLIGNIGRDLGGRSRGRNAGNRNIGRSARRDIRIFRLHRDVIERVGRHRRRGDHQAGRDGTLRAVRRTVDDTYLIRALLTCRKRGRTAAIEIDSCNTAGLEHDLRQLMHRSAAGKRLLTTVEHHHHDLTLGRDTDAGA